MWALQDTIQRALLQAVINPVSTTGRQLSHLLHYLHTSLHAEVEVVLNPDEKEESMPLNSYYTFAAPPVGPPEGVAATKAQLCNVPGNKILTMSVEVPEAWLVEVRAIGPCCRVEWSAHTCCTCVSRARVNLHAGCWRTEHVPVSESWHMLQVVSADLDTDNLKLDDLGDAPGMEVRVELEAVMLTGACIDTAFEKSEDLHPRGTQLILQDSHAKPLQDTLVMQNFGYFQLKTSPGVHASRIEVRKVWHM
jgi:UDP-glucose:glycoprotein glucosyltransferase